MKKKLTLILALAVMFLWYSPVFALDSMGPASSELEKGQFSLGADYSWSEMDIELENGRIIDRIYQFGSLASTTSTEISAFEIKNLEMQKVYGNIGYGIANNWDIFLRLGIMHMDFSADLYPNNVDSEKRNYDGDSDFAIGFGTKTTFYEKDKLALGGLFQMSWASSDAEKKSVNLTESVELDIVEMQIAVGPTYELANNIRVYGGPFWHYISFGDSELQGHRDFIDPSASEQKISDASYDIDIDDKDQLGGYVGLQADLTKNTLFSIEYQHTEAADVFAMSLKLKF
jgi:hypothetical protein